jgi:hypothetical protein
LPSCAISPEPKAVLASWGIGKTQRVRNRQAEGIDTGNPRTEPAAQHTSCNILWRLDIVGCALSHRRRLKQLLHKGQYVHPCAQYCTDTHAYCTFSTHTRQPLRTQDDTPASRGPHVS